jgi:hypothetical protein
VTTGSATARWEAVAFERDEAFWGFVLRDDEGRVHVYERTSPDGTVRRVAPAFTRFEHAQLFLDAWPERPVLTRGPSYDLGALVALAEGRAVDARAVEDAWLFALDVLDAAEEGDDLEMPDEGVTPDEDEVREGLSRLARVIEQLDR